MTGGSWHVGPVLRGIRGHRAAAVLVAVQLGIGLAITVLAVLIGDYFRNHVSPSPPGAHDDLTIVELQLPGRMPADEVERRRAAVLAELRATPGCAAAAVVGELPVHMLEPGHDDLRRSPDDPPVRAYATAVGAGVATTAALTVQAGRDFLEDDLRAAGPTRAIVSASVARALWPDRDPIGASFLSRAVGRATVVGVVADAGTTTFGPGAHDVLYARVDGAAARMVVLVRSAPGASTALREALRTRLPQPGQHATVSSAAAYSRQLSSPVGTVLGILATIVGVIVLVVLVGSMGLTYYLVDKRTREIGMRRALGAKRRDIVRYFLVENMLLTAAGAVIGAAIVAVALPVLFREQEGFSPRWSLVAIAGAAMLGLNLIATLVPASKAAAIPPVVASRTT